MTKKANVGGVNTLAGALQSAGVVPTTPASADETVIAAPASADAAVSASTELAEEIAEAKKAWEHAKAGGITRQQFEHMCSYVPEKAAFLEMHKKAIFGSKKQRLDEAAEEIVNANTVVNTVNKINEAPDYVRRALKLIKKGEQITQYLESLSKAQRKEVKDVLIQNYETNKGKKKVANANGYPDIPLMHSLGWRADLYQ